MMQPYRSRRTIERNGFTLIEMLVTLAIAAMIAGIAFPAVERSIDYWDYRSAATSLELGLHSARAAAMRSGTATRFALDGDRRGFRAAGQNVRLAPSIFFDNGPAAIAFYPDGSSSGGRIGIRGTRLRHIVSISPDTGLIGEAG